MHNDSLLALLETFTANEKNSFKRYITFTGGGRVLKYAELYSIYNKCLNTNSDSETLDKKIKAVLKKKPKLSKDLNNIRKRLKDKLIESLTIQNSNRSQIIEMSQQISGVRILVERKLYATALSKLKQLKEKAKSFNYNNFLVELIEIEISIIEKNSTKYDETHLTHLIKEQENYLHLYSIELRLKNISTQINIIIEKDLQLNEENNLTQLHHLHNELQAILIDEHLKNKQVRIVFWYYKIKNIFFRAIREIDLAYKHSKELIAFFETDKILMQNYEREYIKAICNFSRTCFVYDKTDELDTVLSKVQKIFKRKKNYTALEATCDMGVLHYLNTFQYEKAVEMVALMEENWETLKEKTIDGKLLWYAHTNTLLYWVLDDQKKINVWGNRGLQIQRPFKGKSFLFGIRMLMLIYDIDNDELLHFNEKAEALQKTMNNNEQLRVLEKVVLKYLKKIAKVSNSKYREIKKTELKNNLIADFKNELVALKDIATDFISSTGNYQEILLWCESHIQKKSIRTVFENTQE